LTAVVLTIEILDLESLFLESIVRSDSYIKVIGSKLRSQKQKRVSVCASRSHCCLKRPGVAKFCTQSHCECGVGYVST